MTLAPVLYEDAVGDWTTPNGHIASFAYRKETNDWNTLSSILTSNEYRLPSGISGVALDIGSYLGGVAIALALDNPDLHVVAVEPVPDNVRLIRQSIEANGLTDRIRLIDGALAGREPSVTISYGYRGTASLEHHAFVGNSTLAYDDGGAADHDERVLTPITLTRLLKDVDVVAWTKIDCEGGEFSILSDPGVRKLAYIIGEWHNVRGHVQGDIATLLRKTHDVVFAGPVDGPGEFVAVRR